MTEFVSVAAGDNYSRSLASGFDSASMNQYLLIIRIRLEFQMIALFAKLHH